MGQLQSYGSDTPTQCCDCEQAGLLSTAAKLTGTAQGSPSSHCIAMGTDKRARLTSDHNHRGATAEDHGKTTGAWRRLTGPGREPLGCFLCGKNCSNSLKYLVTRLFTLGLQIHFRGLQIHVRGLQIHFRGLHVIFRGLHVIFSCVKVCSPCVLVALV